MDLPVEDRLALNDLLARYFFAVDDQDTAAFETVFLPDSTADLGVPGAAPCADRDEILELILGTVKDLDSTHHLMGTSHVVAHAGTDGDQARGRTQVTAHHFKGGARYTLGCEYHDEFVRTSDGWRIRTRTLQIAWADGDAAVMS